MLPGAVPTGTPATRGLPRSIHGFPKSRALPSPSALPIPFPLRNPGINYRRLRLSFCLAGSGKKSHPPGLNHPRIPTGTSMTDLFAAIVLLDNIHFPRNRASRLRIVWKYL